MPRRRSFWLLVSTLLLGAAVLGLGCERTIGDFDDGGGGGGGGGNTDDDVVIPGDRDFVDDA